MHLHYLHYAVVRLSGILTAVLLRIFLLTSALLLAVLPMRLQAAVILPLTGEQIAFPGDFLPPFDYLNAAANGPLDVDGNGIADIIPACSCGSQPVITNGSQGGAGVFHDQIIIATGQSGQTWRLQGSSGVLRRSSLSPYVNGTIIPELGQSGVYVLPFAHRSGQGFIALVEAPFLYPGQAFGPLENTCYYPTPSFSGLASFYCQDEPDVQMVGTATTAFDNYSTPLEPTLGFFSITRLENNQSTYSSIFSPTTLGPGTYRVRYLFDAGTEAHTAENKTGCIATAEQQVIVRGSSSLACLSSLNISFPASCSILVTPQLVLAGSPVTLDAYSVQVFTSGGINLGNSIPASYTGQTLTAVLTDECAQQTCSTLITVRDVTPPVLQIPPDRTLACNESTATSNTGVATAIDCTTTTITHTDQVTESQCGTNPIVIRRTWRAVDRGGNISTGVQTIRTTRVTQSQLRFPTDVVIGCADYQNNPQLAAPAANGAGVPALVEIAACGLIYTHSDDTLSLCGSMTPDFIIIRTWLMLDICGNSLLTVDGLGNDNIQFIRVADTLGPVVAAMPFTVGADLLPLTQNGLCRSQGFIPAATVADACNGYAMRIYTPLGEALYPVGETDGRLGGEIPFPGLPPGEYEIVYEAIDDCGNTTTASAIMTVEDVLPPVSLCQGQLTVSLPPGGLARLEADDVDEGSRDYCCAEVELLIKLEEEPDSLFRAFIDFDCTNTQLTVVMQVTDCNGLTNTCETVVTLEDRQPVLLQQAPPNQNISCADDYSSYLQAGFQAPVFTDNCAFEVDFVTQLVLDSCGIGYLDRTWTARDNPGNFPATYTQRINLRADHIYSFSLPADGTGDCEALVYDEPAVLASEGCNNLMVSATQEQVSLSGGDACYEIRRTYTLVNACEYDGVSPATILSRFDDADADLLTGDGFVLESDGQFIYRVSGQQTTVLGPATGHYKYVQHIPVFDVVPPQIADPGSLAFCLPADGFNSCEAQVSIPLSGTDNCSDSIAWSYTIRLYGQGQSTIDTLGALVTRDGGWLVEGQYPLGSHELQINAVDVCGNVAVRTLVFEVNDCTPPLLSCLSDAEYSLSEDGSLIIAVSDLVAFASDNCGVPSLSLDPNDSEADSLFFSCDNLGDFPVIIYAIDAVGLRQSCSLTLSIAALGEVCNATHRIEGYVRRENGDPVAQTTVSLGGPYTATTTTDATGYYFFEDVPDGTGYTLSAARNDAHSNGISTFDLILMTRQILNIQLLDSPYKMIAADINKSTAISTADAIRLRRIILDIDSVFTDNTSWRFIDERYLFLNPQFPLVEPYPETILIDSLKGDRVFHFIGVKVGDLNNSASPALLGSELSWRTSGESTVALRTPDLMPGVGDELTVVLQVAQDAVAGGQLSLAWNPDWLTWVGLTAGGALEGPEQLNAQKAAAGKLSLCWHPSAAEAEPEIRLQFRARATVPLSSHLRLTDDPTPAEVYVQAAGIQSLLPELIFEPTIQDTEEAAAGVSRLSVPWPNPSSGVFYFPLKLASDSEVVIWLYDAWGRLCHRQQVWLAGGAHEWPVLAPAGGWFFYRLEADGQVLTGKLLKE